MKGVYILLLAVIVAVYICPARSQRPNEMPRSSTKKGSRPRGAPPVTRFLFSGNRGHSKIRTITKQGSRPSWRSPSVNTDRPRQKIPKPPQRKGNNGNNIGDNNGRRWDQSFTYMTMAGMNFNPIKHPPILTRNNDPANAHSGTRSAPSSRPHKSRPVHKSAVKQTPVAPAPTTQKPPASAAPTTKKPSTSAPTTKKPPTSAPAVVVPAAPEPVVIHPAAPASTKAQGNKQKPQIAESTPGQFLAPQLPMKLPPYTMNPPSVEHTKLASPKAPAAKVPLGKTTTQPISIKEEYQPIRKHHSIQQRKLALKRVFLGTNSKSIPRPPALPTTGNVGSIHNPASNKKVTYRMYSSWKDAPGVQTVRGAVGSVSTAAAGAAAHAVAESKATAADTVSYVGIKHMPRSSSLSYATSVLALAESLFAKARAGNIPMNSPARRPSSFAAGHAVSNTVITGPATSNNKHGHGIQSSGTINQISFSRHTALEPSTPKAKALPYQSPPTQTRFGSPQAMALQADNKPRAQWRARKNDFSNSGTDGQNSTPALGGSGVKKPSSVPYGSTSRSSVIGGGQETTYFGNGQATTGQGVHPPASVVSGHVYSGHSSGSVGGGQETIYFGNEQATAGQGVHPPANVGLGHVDSGHSSGHIGGGQETIYHGNGQETSGQEMSRTTKTSGHSGAQYGGQTARSQEGQSNRNFISAKHSPANNQVETPTTHTQIGSASQISTNEYELNYIGYVHSGSSGLVQNEVRNSNQGLGETGYEQGMAAEGSTTGQVYRRDNIKPHQSAGGQELGHTRSVTSSMRQAHVQTKHQGSSRGFGSRASSKHSNGEQEVSERTARPNTFGASVGSGLSGAATTGGSAAKSMRPGAQTPAHVVPVQSTRSGAQTTTQVEPVQPNGYGVQTAEYVEPVQPTGSGVQTAEYVEPVQPTGFGVQAAVHVEPVQPTGSGGPRTKPCRVNPVCGSDGFTYMSECFIWTGISKACDGFCPCVKQYPSPPANTELPSTPMNDHGPSPAEKRGRPPTPIRRNETPPPANKQRLPTPTKEYVPPPANNRGPPQSVNAQIPPIPTKGHGPHPSNNWGPSPSATNQRSSAPTKGHGSPASNNWEPPSSANNHRSSAPTKGHGPPPSNNWGPPSLANNQKSPTPTKGHGPPPSNNWGPPSLANNQKSHTPTKGHGSPPSMIWVPPSSASKHIPATPTRDYVPPISASKWGPPPSTNQYGPPPSTNKQRRPIPTEGHGPPPSTSKWGPPPYTNQHGSPPSANRMGPPLGDSYRTHHSQPLTLPGSRVPPKKQQVETESILADVPPTCRCPRIYRPVCSVLDRTYDNDCLRKCSYDGFKCQGVCPCGTHSATYQADDSARPKVYSTQETPTSTQTRQHTTQTRQQTTQRRQQTTTRGQGLTGVPNNSRHQATTSKEYHTGVPSNSIHQYGTSNERPNGVPIHSIRGRGSNGAPSQTRPTSIPQMLSTTYAQLQTPSRAAHGPNGVAVQSHRQANGPNGVPVVHRQSLERNIEQGSRETVQIHLSKTTRGKPSLRSIGSQNRKPSTGTRGGENVLELESRGGPDPCHCNDIYSPVCGTDGVTYTNPCEVSCSATVGSACNGECPCDPFAVEPMYYCEDYCSQSQQPVCSEWGRIYQNDCLRKCSNEAKDCDGECPCPAAQPQYVPEPSQYNNQPVPYVPQPIQYNNPPAPYDPHQPQYSNNQTPLFDHPISPAAYNDPPPQHLLPPTQTRYHTNPNNYNAEPSNQPASTCECTTTDIDPVCTTGGQTYWYGCQAICSGMTIACSSECPC